jgi:hypothetical protein
MVGAFREEINSDDQCQASLLHPPCKIIIEEPAVNLNSIPVASDLVMMLSASAAVTLATLAPACFGCVHDWQ